MKRQQVIYTIGVFVLVLASACGNKAPAVDYSQVSPPRIQQDNQSRELIQQFVDETISTAMMHSEIAQIVADRSEHYEISQLARWLIMDYRSAGAELKSIAAGKGWTWPSKMSGKHETMVDRLRAMEHESLDPEYLDFTIRAHEDALAAFEQSAGTTDDAQLKKWIQKRLPVMRTHLEQCRQLSSGLSERT